MGQVVDARMKPSARKQLAILRNPVEIAGRLYGAVFHHPEHKPGDHVTTTMVMARFERDGMKFAETINTVYLLIR